MPALPRADRGFLDQGGRRDPAISSATNSPSPTSICCRSSNRLGQAPEGAEALAAATHLARYYERTPHAELCAAPSRPPAHQAGPSLVSAFSNEGELGLRMRRSNPRFSRPCQTPRDEKCLLSQK